MKSQFQFGNYEKPSGRGLDFSKMPEFQIFTFIENEKWACIRCRKSKMSDPRGKMSEIQKSVNYPMGWGGGGSSLFGNFPQIFPFFFMMAPLNILPFSAFPRLLLDNPLSLTLSSCVIHRATHRFTNTLELLAWVL